MTWLYHRYTCRQRLKDKQALRLLVGRGHGQYIQLFQEIDLARPIHTAHVLHEGLRSRFPYLSKLLVNVGLVLVSQPARDF